MPEKKWIFDTVVLSNFLLSDTIFILEKRYAGRAVITNEVFDELSAGFSEFPSLKVIQEVLRDQMFTLLSLSPTEYERYQGLINHLGKGEASCNALARTRNGVVMTDDRAARNQCSQLNIPFSGTIGILKSAYLDKQIELKEADAVLHRMISQGFYSPVRNISDIV
ncbi:MAG: hypothetical protein HQ517_14110 [SAR324 cluster bacterium]|nr:hypothetical protein [SAR324 cluster bacterium]